MTRTEVTSACPSCGAVATRHTYDVGSGPELSCGNCEWCWGAEGQDLNPLDVRTLYDIARQVTDEVLGEGTYAEVNAGNRHPGVQAAIRRTTEAAPSGRFYCGHDDCYYSADTESRVREHRAVHSTPAGKEDVGDDRGPLP